MSKLKNKLIRYRNLIENVINWKSYIWRKGIGFQNNFDFDIKGFGQIAVPKEMLGPFRENFLDNIYFRYIPDLVFKKNDIPTIVDIGANVGYFSLAVFSKFPNATVHAFEPHPYCYKVLLNYKQKYQNLNWKVYNKAVSDKNGEIELGASTVDGFTTTAGIIEAESNKSFSVEAIKFNTFLNQIDLPFIDFMKLDCEGSEYSILYSIHKGIFGKIKSFCIETHKGKSDGQDIDTLNNYLKVLGFETKISKSSGNTGYIWGWQETK